MASFQRCSFCSRREVRSAVVTLSPVEDLRVTIPPQDCWVDPGREERCCNPTCGGPGAQEHHIVRRSATAGPKRWVNIDGLVLLNARRVCLHCHEEINNHRVWIRYLTGESWVWYGSAGRATAGIEIDGYYAITHPKSGRVFIRIGPLKEIM